MNSRDTTQQQSAFMWLPATSEESRKLSAWLPLFEGNHDHKRIWEGKHAQVEKSKQVRCDLPFECTNAPTMAGKELLSQLKSRVTRH